MKSRVLAVLLLALAGTLLAASSAAPEEASVSVIEPLPPLPSDGGQ